MFYRMIIARGKKMGYYKNMYEYRERYRTVTVKEAKDDVRGS